MAEDPDPSKYLFVTLEQKRKDQSKPYDGKKMVWVPDEKECYVLGNIKETKGDLVVVEVGKGDDVSRLLLEPNCSDLLHASFAGWPQTLTG